eukprot:366253-Chlamydomonas_euryale.AAC.5
MSSAAGHDSAKPSSRLATLAVAGPAGARRAAAAASAAAAAAAANGSINGRPACMLTSSSTRGCKFACCMPPRPRCTPKPFTLASANSAAELSIRLASAPLPSPDARSTVDADGPDALFALPLPPTAPPPTPLSSCLPAGALDAFFVTPPDNGRFTACLLARRCCCPVAAAGRVACAGCCCRRAGPPGCAGPDAPPPPPPPPPPPLGPCDVAWTVGRPPRRPQAGPPPPCFLTFAMRRARNVAGSTGNAPSAEHTGVGVC